MNFHAVSSAVTKPAQPALRSNVPARSAPSSPCTTLAVGGEMNSGVSVAMMMSWTSSGERPAARSARRAAATASVAVLSSLVHQKRWWMPSVSSTNGRMSSPSEADSSSLVTRRDGTACPVPVMMA